MPMNAPQINHGTWADATDRSKNCANKAPPAVAGVPANVKKSPRRHEMTREERHRMIAEATCYRALRRGFHGGADLEDWLDAEAEMDKLLWRG